jgi:hypothetical protein
MACSVSDMSVTFWLTGAKVRKISETTKYFGDYFLMYFPDNQPLAENEP